MTSRASSFLTELKRRKVYRTGAVYVVAGLGVLGAAEVILDPLGLSALRFYLVVLVLLGFPIALALSWFLEVRTERSSEGESHPPSKSASLGERERKSIIVLPFDNMSPDPGDSYFSDGLTEEIIANLSCLHSLRVISRNSAMALKGTSLDTRAIAEKLDVQFVLEGSVRKTGSKLRITAQLIDALSDEHLWAEKFDGVLDDIFGMQESVARAIAGKLTLDLSRKEDRRLAARPMKDFAAYECYLRARQKIWEGTPGALEDARRDLMTARGLVGDNPLIFAGLGYVFLQKANFGHEQEEAVKRSEEYARKALELEPACAEAEVVLGAGRQAFYGDQRTAIQHLERAREIDPNNPDAVLWLLNATLLVGRMGDARALADLLVAVDPLNAINHAVKGVMHWYEGDVGKAAESTHKAYEMAPDSAPVVLLHSVALARARDLEGFTVIRDHGLPPDSVITRVALMHEAAAKGDRETVLDLITEDVEQTCKRDCQWSHFLAATLSEVGEVETAHAWMETSVDLGFVNFPVIAETDRMLTNVRKAPGFEQLLSRVRDEWETYQ